MNNVEFKRIINTSNKGKYDTNSCIEYDMTCSLVSCRIQSRIINSNVTKYYFM